MVTDKLQNFVRDNARIFALVLGLGFLSVFGFTDSVGASGSAYFVVSGSGSYKVGSTVTINVYESATGADDVNAVQANLSYSSTLLTYKSLSVDGPFTLCTQQSGGGGSVAVACAATSAQSGEKAVAKVTFTAKAKGSAHVDIASGSDIDNTSGSSVWNGTYPGSSITVTSTTTSSGGSTDTSSTPSSSTKSSTTTKKTTTPKKTTTTKTTTPSTNTIPTTTPTNAAATSSTATYTITVTGSNGQPVANAKVSLDSNISANTNSEGKATFNGMGTGTYNVTVTAPGKKAYKTSVTLTANEDKLASVKLASSSSMLEYIVAAVLLVLILGTLGFMIYRKRHPKFQGPTGPTAAPPAAPAAPAPPTGTTTPTNAPPPTAPSTPPTPPSSSTPTSSTSRMSSYTAREVAPTAARIVDSTEPQATWPPVIGNTVN